MGKYIKLFSGHTDYEQFVGSSSYKLPNVSYCEGNDHTHYNPQPSDDELVLIVEGDGENLIPLFRGKGGDGDIIEAPECFYDEFTIDGVPYKISELSEITEG